MRFTLVGGTLFPLRVRLTLGAPGSPGRPGWIVLLLSGAPRLTTGNEPLVTPSGYALL
ncbi:hypothetical protein [Paenibacillus segetis]|uniref:hypothetical protein n=1 Tax=Paenibacillus segetis TaxID=1325360 RepID=UPI001889836C|nr:hypothetical protein [Paenibacillus segetis]